MIGCIIETRPITVTFHCRAEYFSELRINLAVMVSTHGAVYFDHLIRKRKRYDDFSWIQSILWIKGFLDAAEFAVEFFSEEILCVLTTKSPSMFCPHHPFVFDDQIPDGI